MANIFEEIASKILHGRFCGAISGYQTEIEQEIMDKISHAWEIEDPNDKYDEIDKLISATGTVKEMLDDDEQAAQDLLEELS